jgi:hypothetical protein
MPLSRVAVPGTNGGIRCCISLSQAAVDGSTSREVSSRHYSLAAISSPSPTSVRIVLSSSELHYEGVLHRTSRNFHERTLGTTGASRRRDQMLALRVRMEELQGLSVVLNSGVNIQLSVVCHREHQFRVH